MSAVRRGNRWEARISVNNVRIALGQFATPEEARLACARAVLVLAPQRIRKLRQASDPAARFWGKTSVQSNGCILWLAAKDKDGYGKFQINGYRTQRHVRAHRYAYFLRHGIWPHDLALHRCDNASCVNPDHLEDGDQGKNVRDCVARGRHRYAKR